MSALSNASRPLKGALVAFRQPDPTPQVISFQYNPETVQRTIEAQTSGEAGAPGEALRLSGAPVETLKLEIELDAADQLDAGSDLAAAAGIHPQLALLELLLYPHSALVIANTALLAAGTIEILSHQSPFVLLVWGPKRILPVRLTEFGVSEEAYDAGLNPMRAKISLGLRALSYNDLARTHPGYHLFLAHQVTKEALALVGRAQSLSAVLGGEARLT